MSGERESEFIQPTDEDLAWLESSVQRHTGGINSWWDQNKDKLSFRDFARIVIGVWEAGRSKAGIGPESTSEGAGDPQ